MTEKPEPPQNARIILTDTGETMPLTPIYNGTSDKGNHVWSMVLTKQTDQVRLSEYIRTVGPDGPQVTMAAEQIQGHTELLLSLCADLD